MSTPNVLFILADDLGWGDVGYHGARFDTPNIDRLARLGLELDRHYVCPVCTPTRTSFLTGRYPGRFGKHATKPTNRAVLPDGYGTMATLFHDAGYATGLFGKWHLGSTPAVGPQAYGFDHAYGSLAGGVDPYTHRYKKGPFSRTWHRNGELIDESGHATDLITDEAVRWIEARTEPWFAYVPFTAVHHPVNAPERWVDGYAGRFDDEDDDCRRALELYGGYTSHMDHCIGRLIDAAKARDVLHNTIVIFASDNGAPMGDPSGDIAKYPGYHESQLSVGTNGPLHGEKGTLYEGGIRTPAVLYWQGCVEPGTLRAPIGVADWLPTFAEMLDVEADPRYDGRSIWRLLQGGEAQSRTFHWNMGHDRFAVLQDDWKLIYRSGGEGECELFNLADDPYEDHNLAPDQPERVAELRRLILRNHEADDADVREADPEAPIQSAAGDP